MIIKHCFLSFLTSDQPYLLPAGEIVSQFSLTILEIFLFLKNLAKLLLCEFVNNYKQIIDSNFPQQQVELDNYSSRV